MKWLLWTKPYESGDARIIIGADDTAPPPPWAEKQGLSAFVPPSAGSEQLFDKPRAAELSDCADTKRSQCATRAAHAEFIAALMGQSPRAIPLDVEATDLENRVDHLKKVFNAFDVYVTAVLHDTAQNGPGRLGFGDFSAALSDLASDVTGTIQLAADAMAAGRVA